MQLLIGIWIYTSLIYMGIPYPRPDADLKMYFTFINENENQLFYFRESETGHCRRTAEYRFEKNKIYQKITAVDSSNSIICGNDPDMQIGAESVSDLEVTEHCLYLTLPLGDESITYVWQKSDAENIDCVSEKLK